MDSYSNSDFSTLRSIPELLDVPDLQLRWLLTNSSIRILQGGEFLFEPETLLDHIYFVVEGSVDLFVLQGERKRVIFQHRKGAILGYFPYSDVLQSVAYGQATTTVRLVSYPKSKIQELIIKNSNLTEALVKILVFRAKNFTAQTLQNEKMLALGKLSAGLSHELNNPISSIQRDTSELSRLFLTGNLLELIVSNTGLNTAEKEAFNQTIIAWLEARRAPGLKPSEIRLLEIDWLEKLKKWGMQHPDEAAEVFTDSGLDCQEVNYWVKKIPPEKIDTWLRSIQFLLQSKALVYNLQDATDRIKSLINAVKSFTHMGRESIRTNLDLRTGIQNTLTILSHKLRKSKIEVVFFKPEYPILISGFASELNQVWTNLIDNAIDAMEGISAPKLEITIISNTDLVSVQISDNGSGIPDEIKSQIFEPFFTTKEMGKGSGMGLDLVNQIILKHSGKIDLVSAPGKTTFHLEFPKS